MDSGAVRSARNVEATSRRRLRASFLQSANEHFGGLAKNAMTRACGSAAILSGGRERRTADPWLPRRDRQGHGLIRGCTAIANEILGGRGPSARPRSSCSTLGAKALVASAGFAMQHGCLATSYYRRLDAKSRPRAGSNGADSRATFEFAQPRLGAAVEDGSRVEPGRRYMYLSKIRVSFLTRASTKVRSVSGRDSSRPTLSTYP